MKQKQGTCPADPSVCAAAGLGPRAAAEATLCCIACASVALEPAPAPAALALPLVPFVVDHALCLSDELLLSGAFHDGAISVV